MDINPNWQVGGWRCDLENRETLRKRLSSIYVLRRWREIDFTVPDEVDPRDWLKVENQGQIGSCQGQSLTTNAEIAYKIATGNRELQFSRHAAYIWSQRIDGIKGDNGSTLEAGQQVAEKIGFCLESTVPYPSMHTYTNKIPNEAKAKAEAAQYRIAKSAQCQTYDDVFEWISKGFGGVQLGIAWPNSWMNNNGTIESFSPGGGGHAIAFVGYLKDKASDGRNRLILANSWGKDWGDGGYSIVAPKAVDQMLRHSWTVMIGHTDMTSPEPREWTFTF